jgi:hypothetical protein
LRPAEFAAVLDQLTAVAHAVGRHRFQADGQFEPDGVARSVG